MDVLHVFLFEKQDKGNLGKKELTLYKDLAKDYGKMDSAALDVAVKARKLVEI